VREVAHNLQTNIIIGGHVAASLRAAFGLVNSQAANAAAGMSKLGKVGGMIGAGLKVATTALTVGLTAAATGVTVLGQKGLKLASDIQEVQNVVDVTFGDNANQINEWSKQALKAFGLTELQAKQFTGTMGAMLKSSGLEGQNIVNMSENLTGLAGDLASFYNISQDNAWEKVRAGISGETLPLKELGINMNIANLEAYALSKGIKVSYEKMNQASQVALRYSYLMAQSKDAQGDFLRTQESFANQTRILKSNFDSLLAEIAVKFLPVATNVISMLNKVQEGFLNDSQAIGTVQGVIEKAINTFNSFVPVVMDLGYQMLPYLKNSFNAIAPVVQMLINKLLIPLVPVITNLIKAVLPLVDSIIIALKPAIDVIINVFWKLMNTILPPTITLINKLKDLFVALVPAISWVTDVVGTYISSLIDIAGPILSNFIGILGGITDFLTGVFTLNWKKAWNGIKDILFNLFKGIGKIILAPLNYAFSQVNSFIDGINKINIPIVGKLNIPKLPILALAQGATVTAPTLALIGEAGVAETAIPHTNTPRSRSLLREAAAGVGVGMGNTIHVTYAPNFYGGAPEEQQRASFENFKIWIEEYFAGQRRESYGF
jgi:phage-related protein